MCTCRSNRCATLFGLPLVSGIHCGMTGEPPIRRRDWLGAVGSAAALVWASPAWASGRLSGKTTRYDFVSSGVVKGSQTTIRLPDGSREVLFEFTDRGRGPKLRSTLNLDGAGFITKLQTTGYNYLKVPVNERFVARGGTAT
jgi:hypothetical protein